jgi:hypothetical protein
MPGESSNDLVAAILAAAPNNKQLQQALLVGSSGESNLNPLSVGSGGYGAFGFTSSEYTSPGGAHYVAQGASPALQVAAILPAYISSQQQLPASVTNPQAQAEWIAINAENPRNNTTDLQTIEQTNAPTTYGANYSYSAGNWNAITQITSGTPANVMAGTATAAGSAGSTLPSAQIAGNQPAGSQGTGLLSNCGSYRNSSAATTNCLVGGGGGVLGLPCVLNACQAKALISGGIILGGALVMLVAVALLFTDSKAGLTTAIGLAAKNLATRTPGGAATMVYVDKAGNRVAAPSSGAPSDMSNTDFA